MTNHLGKEREGKRRQRMGGDDGMQRRAAVADSATKDNACQHTSRFSGSSYGGQLQGANTANGLQGACHCAPNQRA